MAFMHKMFAVVATVFVLLAYPAQSEAQSNIVPGKSLGEITIGESREDVLAATKARPTNNYDLKHGLVEDEWIARLTYKDGTRFSIFVSIWYRQNKVVQIESQNQSVNFVGSSNSISSFNSLIADNNNLKKICYSIGAYDEKGEAFEWGDLLYYDDVKDGIAYGADLQDDLVLTNKPERINVHLPGTPVIPFNGLTNVKLDTSGDIVTYKTASDQNKYHMAQARAYQLKAKVTKPAIARIRKRHTPPVVVATNSRFPFKWGPYTIKVVKSTDASSPYPQELRICNAMGKILWKTEANSNATVSKCKVLGDK